MESQVTHNLCSIEPSTIPAKASPARQLSGQVTTGVKIHDEKKVLFIMEAPPELDDERILCLVGHALEDGLFSECMLQLLVGKDMAFRNSLESIQARTCTVAHE